MTYKRTYHQKSQTKWKEYQSSPQYLLDKRGRLGQCDRQAYGHCTTGQAMTQPLCTLDASGTNRIPEVVKESWH